MKLSQSRKLFLNMIIFHLLRFLFCLEISDVYLLLFLLIICFADKKTPEQKYYKNLLYIVVFRTTEIDR